MILVTLVPFHFHRDFRICSVDSCRIWIWIMLNLLTTVGRSDTLTVLSLPVQEYAISLPLFWSFLICFISVICSFQHAHSVHILLDLYSGVSSVSVVLYVVVKKN